MKIITVQDLPSLFNIGIVTSRFNTEITQAMFEHGIERLQELGLASEQITAVSVPGAIEIPITLQQLAQTKKFSCLVAYGCVIRGETSHYDYVCQQVSQGCQQVALNHSIPVIFGVLTTENKNQAKDRLGGKHGNVARDAIDAAFEMVSILQQIKENN